jgi:Domain of unknown function (DUF4328)
MESVKEPTVEPFTVEEITVDEPPAASTPAVKTPFLPARETVAGPAEGPLIRPAYQPISVPPEQIAYAANISKLRSTRARGRIALLLIWLCTIASGLVMFAVYSRRMKWRDFVDHQATLDDLDKADKLVLATSTVQIAAFALGGFAVAMWSRRVAKNAVARGAYNVSVARATIGWLIPIGHLWIGFSSVRAAVTQLGERAKKLGLWQGAFLFSTLATTLAGLGTRSLDVAQSPADVTNTLNRQLVISAVSFATLALAAVFGTMAIKEVNHVASDRPGVT